MEGIFEREQIGSTQIISNLQKINLFHYKHLVICTLFYYALQTLSSLQIEGEAPCVQQASWHHFLQLLSACSYVSVSHSGSSQNISTV